MAERLASGWRADLSIEALIELRDELDAMLTRIRSERSVLTPVFTCPECGSTGPGAEPHASVRALIFALARFGIATAEVGLSCYGYRVLSGPVCPEEGMNLAHCQRNPLLWLFPRKYADFGLRSEHCALHGGG